MATPQTNHNHASTSGTGGATLRAEAMRLLEADETAERLKASRNQMVQDLEEQARILAELDYGGRTPLRKRTVFHRYPKATILSLVLVGVVLAALITITCISVPLLVQALH